MSMLLGTASLSKVLPSSGIHGEEALIIDP